MPPDPRFLPRRSLLLAAPLWAATGLAAGEVWPGVTRCVLLSSPGGGLDRLMRGLGAGLASALATSIVIEHRPGAAGLLAARAVAWAPADGSTLLYLSAAHVTLQAMGARLDLFEDLTLVARVHDSPHMLAVAAGTGPRTFAELLDAIRSRPGSMSYGTGGQASPSHLVVERLLGRWSAMPRPLHVPFSRPARPRWRWRRATWTSASRCPAR